MKKLVFVFVAMIAMSFVSCNNSVKATDSVDTVVVDTVDTTTVDSVDSISADSVK